MNSSELNNFIEIRFLRKKPWIFSCKSLFILGVLLICLSGIYFVNGIPRFINLPIHSPDYYFSSDIGDWKTVTYSVYQYTFFPSIISQMYILRKESVVLDNYPSWNTIATYFDNHLGELGWIRSDPDITCNLYLPEANFLAKGENGFINYRRKNYQAMIDYDEGDIICLAIWKQKDHFNIVFLTARPSILRMLSSFFS
jgi:hypothetical protein